MRQACGHVVPAGKNNVPHVEMTCDKHAGLKKRDPLQLYLIQFDTQVIDTHVIDAATPMHRILMSDCHTSVIDTD